MYNLEIVFAAVIVLNYLGTKKFEWIIRSVPFFCEKMQMIFISPFLDKSKKIARINKLNINHWSNLFYFPWKFEKELHSNKDILSF